MLIHQVLWKVQQSIQFSLPLRLSPRATLSCFESFQKSRESLLDLVTLGHRFYLEKVDIKLLSY